MPTPSFDSYGGTAPENYERYFVPAIGAPLAADLLEAVEIDPGERVLDVACGTGIVARLAADRVGQAGQVAGLDANPGMLAVARAAAPSGAAIAWHEASAMDMPLADGAFDLVLCQMGLQFFEDPAAALGEMNRVTAPEGRIALNLPGPMPDLFAIMGRALARHVGPAVEQFVQAVFSLHDAGQVVGLLEAAGYSHANAERTTRNLRLPAPAEFLWQYVCSTPLAGALASVDEATRDAIERDVVAGWQPFTDSGGMTLPVGVLIATGRKH